jgi:hypothetical protein
MWVVCSYAQFVVLLSTSGWAIGERVEESATRRASRDGCPTEFSLLSFITLNHAHSQNCSITSNMTDGEVASSTTNIIQHALNTASTKLAAPSYDIHT